MKPPQLAIATCALLMCSWQLYAEDARKPGWDFVKTTANFYGKWDIDRGHAQVEINGGKVSINIFEKPVPASSGDVPESLSETLVGTIAPDGKIDATLTYLGTDATPFKIEGRLYSHSEKENWGGRDVTVVRQQIIFTNNYMFIGLSRRAKQD